VPAGGSEWQEVQLNNVSGEPAWWQVVHDGPLFSGPVSLWHGPQFAAKPDKVTEVCSPDRKGTECPAPTGPSEWQESPPKTLLKQLGALGSGPTPGASVLWQMAHAVPRFPESRWEGE